MRNKIKPFVVEVKKSKRAKGPGFNLVDPTVSVSPQISWPELTEPAARHFVSTEASDVFAPLPEVRMSDRNGDGAAQRETLMEAPAARVLWVSGFEDPVEARMREDGERRVKRGRKPADPSLPRPATKPRREFQPAVEAKGQPPLRGAPVGRPAPQLTLGARLVLDVHRRKRAASEELPRADRWKARRLPRHCW
jgi:hypothetical protein